MSKINIGKIVSNNVIIGNNQDIKIEKLSADKAHVYFWAIPIGTEYEHKGDVWKKISDEKAVDSDGKEWRFESHYGCVISNVLAKEIGIKEDGHRPL